MAGIKAEPSAIWAEAVVQVATKITFSHWIGPGPEQLPVCPALFPEQVNLAAMVLVGVTITGQELLAGRIYTMDILTEYLTGPDFQLAAQIFMHQHAQNICTGLAGAIE